MIALAVAVGCGTREPAPVPPAPEPGSSRLVVLVVVDQLPVRLLDRALPLADGAFARMATGYTAVARHRHLVTETCPGHAAISTGAGPDRTGIVGNVWWEGGEALVYCVSPEHDARLLLADALADRVTDAGGRAVALSLKDRAAVMLGGHHPTATLWMDSARGAPDGAHLERLGSLPDWRCPAQRAWTTLDDAHSAAYRSLFPDHQAFERDDRPTFPHVADCTDVRRFVGSPDAGTWLVDAAIGAVDHLQLGRAGSADLLAVSFSQVDLVGHAYTPDSWEAMDVVLRLDRDLGRLFDHLDRAVGAGAWSVLLTADHGAPGSPQRLPRSLAEDAVLAAREAGPIGPELVFEEPWLWFPKELAPEARTRAVAALRRELEGQPGILAVVDPTGPAPADPTLATALALGVYPGRSGDVAVLRADGWQWETLRGDAVDNRGTTHGSTDALDQRVPFWLWGRGIAPGAATEDLDVRQVAPTAARLLGVDAPRDAGAPPLWSALR